MQKYRPGCRLCVKGSKRVRQEEVTKKGKRNEELKEGIVAGAEVVNSPGYPCPKPAVGDVQLWPVNSPSSAELFTLMPFVIAAKQGCQPSISRTML